MYAWGMANELDFTARSDWVVADSHTEIIPPTSLHPEGGTFQRMAVQFPNGLGISIIRGPGTYGYCEGLFEIAPLDEDGNILRMPEVTGDYDEVAGWLSVAEVLEAAEKIANARYEITSGIPKIEG